MGFTLFELVVHLVVLSLESFVVNLQFTVVSVHLVQLCFKFESEDDLFFMIFGVLHVFFFEL